jgi:hypothetical protein
MVYLTLFDGVWPVWVCGRGVFQHVIVARCTEKSKSFRGMLPPGGWARSIGCGGR